jgi:hypothetical protein
MNSSFNAAVARSIIAASTLSVACSLQMPKENEIFSSAGAGAAVGAGGANAGVGGGPQADGSAGASGQGGASGSRPDSGSSTGGSIGSGTGGTSGSTGTGGTSGVGGAIDGGDGAAFDPNDGLVALYTFDETSGVVAANSKDATMNGTYFGSCGHPNGRFGKAVSMRNSTTQDWVELPPGLLSGLSAATIIIWVRDLSTDRKGCRALDFGSGTGDNFYVVPDQVNPATSLVAGEVAGTHGSLGFVDLWSTSTVSLTDKVWHQVAIAWSAQSIDFYVDGVAMASKANPGTIPSDLGNTMPNWLGRTFNDVYPALYGEIDDLRVYNKPLSQTAIAALYGQP